MYLSNTTPWFIHCFNLFVELVQYMYLPYQMQIQFKSVNLPMIFGCQDREGMNDSPNALELIKNIHIFTRLWLLHSLSTVLCVVLSVLEIRIRNWSAVFFKMG